MEDTERRPIVIAGNGLLGSWMNLGGIWAERSLALGFGVARDLQVEASAVVENTLSYVDSNQQSTLRLVRKALRRLTTYGLDLTDVSEQAALVATT
jgi:hypothetical protein